MAAFLAKQPNGLYCRFSSIVDCPTDYNLTEDDYINLCIERAKEEAKEIIEMYLRPFDEVIENFYPNNMSKEQFENFLKVVGHKEDT